MHFAQSFMGFAAWVFYLLRFFGQRSTLLPMSDHDKQQLDEKDAATRRDDALRRALSTPPKPKQESEKGKGKPKKEKGKTASERVGDEILANVMRLRADVAFLARVARQFRDVSLEAHIAASHGPRSDPSAIA
jgi:hypothetical protein